MATIDDDDDDSDEYIVEERKLEKAFPFYKNTPLLWAAFKGHKRVIWELLIEGYSPNDVDSYGNNAVHLAASNNLYKILSFKIPSLHELSSVISGFKIFVLH